MTAFADSSVGFGLDYGKIDGVARQLLARHVEHLYGHAAVGRDPITQGLAWAGPVPIHVVPAQEERRIAADALATLRVA